MANQLVYVSITVVLLIKSLNAAPVNWVLSRHLNNFEQVHVCLPSNSCDPKEIKGIILNYTCKCFPGFAGSICDQSTSAEQTFFPKSFVDHSLKSNTKLQQFYCEYQNTDCVNGIAVILNKTAVCG
ncbi:hypothetical protein M3Y98_00229600 [Aphelenchoides besseyi]|nr:hypothetical protein M3Y98_00229600 [Aphelenchoides besseyi]KAI6200574.1 hypothetical protein M3Y96_00748400 [Aphelenchoides besseyi]